MQPVIDENYKIHQKLYQGTNCTIYQANDIKTGQQLAIKLSKTSAKKKSPLINQIHLLRHLIFGDSLLINKGIPKLYTMRQQSSINNISHSYIVMELLGPTIKQRFIQSNKLFSLKTTLMLADQMFRRIQYVHLRHVIHRDINPKNFLFTFHSPHHQNLDIDTDSNRLYLIDFGLGKKYFVEKQQTQQDQNVIGKFQEGKKKLIIGCPRYMSINAHMGMELTKRDDLLSWMYIVCELLFGKLPWQGLGKDNMENNKNQLQQQHRQHSSIKQNKIDKILAIKIAHPSQKLLQNLQPISLRLRLLKIFQSIESLKLHQAPKYEMIKIELKKCLSQIDAEYDFLYDWMGKQGINKEQGK